MSRPFDLIIFDWNGTIEQTETASRTSALQRLSPADQKVFRELYREEKKRLKDECKRNKSLEYHKEDALRRVFLRMPHIEKQVQDEISQTFTARIIFPGAKQLIHTLTKELNIPVALIRNTALPSLQFQQHSLESTGFHHYFNVSKNVVLSGEAGVEKPDPRIFQLAIEKVDMHELQHRAPHRILFIGNETDVDVLGGKQMGWKTVLLRSTERSSRGLADYEIDNYEQLRKLLVENEST